MWHLDVVEAKVPNPETKAREDKLLMVAASYPNGGNSGGCRLLFAESSDGVTWTTYSKPVLVGKAGNWDASEIYRSTLLYDESRDVVRLWYSANSSDGKTPAYWTWRTGYSEQKYASLKAFLNRR